MRVYYWVFLLFMVACSSCSSTNTNVMNNPREKITVNEKIGIVVTDEKGKPLDNVLASIIYATAEKYLKDRCFEIVSKKPDILVFFSPFSDTRQGALPKKRNTMAALGNLFSGMGYAARDADPTSDRHDYSLQYQQMQQQQQAIESSTPPVIGSLTNECIYFLILRPRTKNISPIKIASGYTCGETNSDFFVNEKTIKNATHGLLWRTKTLPASTKCR